MIDFYLNLTEVKNGAGRERKPAMSGADREREAGTVRAARDCEAPLTG